jgi:hypothetical protein
MDDYLPDEQEKPDTKIDLNYRSRQPPVENSEEYPGC